MSDLNLSVDQMTGSTFSRFLDEEGLHTLEERIDEVFARKGEGSSTATKATYEEETALYDHNVGELLYINEHLYKVILAIEAGDEIKETGEGANVTSNTGVANSTPLYIDKLPGSGGGGGTQTGSITISKDGQLVTSLTVDNSAKTINLDALFNTDVGASQVVINSSDSTVATATVNASKTLVTVNGLSAGTCTITINTPATSSYTAASYQFTVVSKVFIPVVGQSYKLGSGAHTSGKADLECVVLDVDGNNALCITKGVCAHEWPGILDLTSIKSAYFGDLASAVSDLYLARGNADGSATTTTPTTLYVYNGSNFVDTYSNDVKSILKAAAYNYESLGANGGSWFGTPYDAGNAWYTGYNGIFASSATSANRGVAPTFILDLTKVKLHGNLIVDINAGDMPKIVSWATGSDEDVANMIDAAHNGTIILSDYWAVGNTRSVEMEAINVSGHQYAKQNVLIVISQFGDYNNAGGKLQFDFLNCLEEKDSRICCQISSPYGYKDSLLQTTIYPAFVEALPEWLSTRLIEFDVKCAKGQTDPNTIITITNQKLCNRASVEIFGNVTGANSSEGSQVSLYTNSAYRIKKQGTNGSAVEYYTRSVYMQDYMAYVDTAGNLVFTDGNQACGVTTFGLL